MWGWGRASNVQKQKYLWNIPHNIIVKLPLMKEKKKTLEESLWNLEGANLLL